MGRFSEEEKAEIVQAYRDGRAITDLVKDHKSYFNTIKKVLKSGGVSIRKEHVKLDDKDRVDIVVRYEAGETIAALCKHYKCSTRQISKTLADAGVKERSDRCGHTSRIPLKQQEEVRRLALQGLKGVQIAEQLGINAETVYRHCKRLGIRVSSKLPDDVRLGERSIEQLDAEIEGLILSGLSRRKIAKDLGVSYRRVNNIALILKGKLSKGESK